MDQFPMLNQPTNITTPQNTGLWNASNCELILRQQPINAKVATGKEKDHKPVDPPPVVQLRVNQASDPFASYLHSPFLFMICNLLSPDAARTQATLKMALQGTRVSSIHRLQDTDQNEGAFFVFGDMSIKLEGTFVLQFNLYNFQSMECIYIKSIVSDPFDVQLAKDWVGMSESTQLTRSFCNQGLRLRLRKEPRSLLRKRGPSSDNYDPQNRKLQGRRLSQADTTDERVLLISPGQQSLASPLNQGEALRPQHLEPLETHHGLPYAPAMQPNPEPEPPHFKRIRTSPQIVQSAHSQPPPTPHQQEQQPYGIDQSLYPATMYPPSQQPYMFTGQPSPQQQAFELGIFDQPPIPPSPRNPPFSEEKDWERPYPF